MWNDVKQFWTLERWNTQKNNIFAIHEFNLEMHYEEQVDSHLYCCRS